MISLHLPESATLRAFSIIRSFGLPVNSLCFAGLVCLMSIRYRSRYGKIVSIVSNGAHAMLSSAVLMPRSFAARRRSPGKFRLAEALASGKSKSSSGAPVIWPDPFLLLRSPLLQSHLCRSPYLHPEPSSSGSCIPVIPDYSTICISAHSLSEKRSYGFPVRHGSEYRWISKIRPFVCK